MKCYFEDTLIKEKDLLKIKKQFPNLEVVENKYDAEILFSMPFDLNNSYLDNFINLKIIQLYTAGYDTLDLDYLEKKKIKLLNAKDVYNIQISEDIISKMLLFNKKSFQYFKQMKNKTWEPLRVTHEIYNSVVAIIGAGSIGLEVAKRLKAFNTKIIGYKRTYEELPYFDEIYINNLNELYKEADYIVITIASNKETKGLINKEAFLKMTKKPLIINVARGDIINEDDLIFALENDLIRGAALDVTNIEPLPTSSKLWELDNVFITPHAANMSPYLKNRLLNALYLTLKNIFNNEPLINEVRVK